MTNQLTSLRTLAKTIDHSLLHPTMTDDDIVAGCQIALQHDVATACVKPYAIPLARRILDGSDVGVCAVVAFPHGNSTRAIKVAETGQAVAAGATEIDVVVNIGKVLGGDWDYVSDEIRAVNEATVRGNAILKVIFENDYLQDEHIVRLCEICSAHGVAFENVHRVRLCETTQRHVRLPGSDRPSPAPHACPLSRDGPDQCGWRRADPG